LVAAIEIRVTVLEKSVTEMRKLWS
jgi:hypothetical protein